MTLHEIADVSQHCKRSLMSLSMPRHTQMLPFLSPPPLPRRGAALSGRGGTRPKTPPMMLHQTSDNTSASDKTAAVAIRHRCPLPLPLPLPSQSFISMLCVLNVYMPPAIVVIIIDSNWCYKKTTISQTLKKIASKQAVYIKIAFHQKLILLPPQSFFCAIVPLNTSLCHLVIPSVTAYPHPIKCCPSIHCASNVLSRRPIRYIIPSSFQCCTINLSHLLQANLDH
jgi:hypothetical protein